ncbi:MAG: DUF805 domain-containing protein [Pseudomonadota bacterium]
MSFFALFTSFSGRINRARWWLGMVVLWVVGLVSAFGTNPALLSAMTDPESLSDPAAVAELSRPSMLLIVISIILTIAALAVIFKRLNDRNWPAIVKYIVGIIYMGATIASNAILFSAPDMLAAQQTVAPLGWAQGIVFLFLLIDNGMLKGTVGPNQYGDDPLGTPALPGTPPPVA